MQILNPIPDLHWGRSKGIAERWFVFFFPFLMMSMAAPPHPQAPSREYQVKAVFLYNFTQFVEWPADAFQKEDAPLVIGILGKDPFGTYLDETVSGEKLNTHPLVVRRFSKVEDITTCHILFVNILEKNVLENIFAHADSHHILTVGDAEVFAKRGGMIRFITDNGKTRIRINLDAAKNADITISSKLLRLAEVVSQKN